MNKQEAIKLLALIKVAYPTAYKDMDQASKQATVNMWEGSFPDIPYPIMEQAFNHFRMVSKFPPTVAEMVDELSHIYHQALEGALTNKALGMEEAARQYWAIMDITARYKDGRNLGGLNIGSLQGLLSGGEQYERLGTPGDYESLENRLPLLDEP
jgi:hypothetical protein